MKEYQNIFIMGTPSSSRINLLVLSSANHPQILGEIEELKKYYKVKYVKMSDYESFVRDKPEKKLWTLLKGIPAAILLAIKFRAMSPFSPASLMLYLLFAPFILNLYKKTGRVDLIYAHWLYPAGLVGLILKRLTNRKLVTVVWGYDIQTSVFEGLTNSLLRGLSKRIIEESDLVITNHLIHRNIAVQLTKSNYNEKILFVPPGNQKLKVEKDRSTKMKIRFSIPSQNRIILYSPSLEDIYGIEEFIELVDKLSAKFPDVSFIIAGGCENKTRRDDIISKINKTRYGDRVEIVGKVPFEDMPSLYDISTVVFDACYIGQGTTTIEAFSLGKPVIGFKTPKRLIDDGVNGYLIEKGDITTLERHLSTLLVDSNLYNRFARNALETFDRKFNVEKRVYALCDLFDNLLAGSPEIR